MAQDTDFIVIVIMDVRRETEGSLSTGYVRQAASSNSKGDTMKDPQRGDAVAVLLIIAFVLLLGGLLFFGLPTWNVWRSGLSGEADLRRAEQDRQIQILEAKAALEAAKYKNEAEVERAKGVAEANKIVADGLGGPEGYLRYLWIQGLQTNQMQVLYIPTEAGLPLLEAGKR